MFLVMRFFQMSGLGREGVYISWAHDTARKEILFLKPPSYVYKNKRRRKRRRRLLQPYYITYISPFIKFTPIILSSYYI